MSHKTLKLYYLFKMTQLVINKANIQTSWVTGMYAEVTKKEDKQMDSRILFTELSGLKQ